MNYSLKSKPELQALRSRFLTALTSTRLNQANRDNIETWIFQIESELLKAAPVATPVKVVTAPAMMTEREKWNCWS